MAVTSQERSAVKPNPRQAKPRPRSIVCSSFPRPRTTYLDFIKHRFKVEPCRVAGCDQDPSRCPFLHPGEEARRRDPRRFIYGTKPCADYIRNGGSCPRGDGCKHAHGYLERRFHPYKIWDEEALEFADLEEHLEEEERLSRRAPERAAIQFILDLKKRRAHFYRYGGPAAIASVAGQLSLYGTGVAHYQHYCQGASIIDDLSGTILNRSCLRLKTNYLSMCGFPFDEEQEENLTASTSILGRTRGESTYVLAGLRLSRFLAPNPGSVEDDFKAPFELDSGASVHAVGKERMLEDYITLPKPFKQIKMADGKSREVVGMGIIKWGFFIIPNVRHVEGLDSILISVNQLDRDHNLSSVFGGGICIVRHKDNETMVFGRGSQTTNGLYKLSFLFVPEPEPRSS